MMAGSSLIGLRTVNTPRKPRCAPTSRGRQLAFALDYNDLRGAGRLATPFTRFDVIDAANVRLALVSERDAHMQARCRIDLDHPYILCGLLPRSLQENMRLVTHVSSLPEPSFLASILRRFGEGGQGHRSPVGRSEIRRPNPVI